MTSAQELGTKVRICTLFLKLDSDIDLSFTSKLRGYIGNRFREFPILHNHVGDLGYVYSYPLVQYKILGGQPVILGVGRGVEAVRMISGELDQIFMGRRYTVISKRIEESEQRLGPSEESVVYEFLSPWLALNEENYRKYLEGSGRRNILSRILIGNILSLCKGLSHQVRTRMRAAAFVRKVGVEYKGVPMIGFTGRFIINYDIPALLGLGKGVSQGFGTVIRVRL